MIYSKISMTISLLLLCIFSACGPDAHQIAALDSLNAPHISAAEYKLAVCPASDKTPDKLSIDVNTDTDTPYVDVNRELKDFGTGFVVNEFFKSERSLFNFMRLVYGTLDQELKYYRDSHGLNDEAISLIFKGGNVLRIVANQVLATLPPEAKTLIDTAFEGNFKRSDADFSVLVNPSLLKGLNYERTMREVTRLTYDTLNKIRFEFTRNPARYFNFMRIAPKEAWKELGEYFGKLQDLPAVSDPNNSNWYHASFAQFQLLGNRANNNLKCRYEGQYDYQYENDPNNPSQIIGTPLSKRPSWIMNTINRTLEWPVTGHPEKTVKFDLVRAKVQFEYTYLKDNIPHRQPIGGELIDVSFPHRKDFRLTNFLANYNRWIANYRLNLKETGESIVIKAESVAGLAADLHEVVFEQFDRPWGDPKYQKRVSRLFFLSITNMLSSQDFGSKEAKAYLEQVQEKIIQPLEGLFPLKAEESHALVDQLMQEASDIGKKYPQMAIANKMWKSMIHLVQSQLLENPQEGDEEKFREFFDLVQNRLETMGKLADMELKTLDLSDIYNASMSSFF